MTKWFLICLVGGIALFFYFYDHKSPAYLAYLRFDHARLAGNCGELQKQVQGPAKAWLDAYCAGGSGGDALAGLAALGDGGPDAAYKYAVTAGGLSGLQDAASISLLHKKVSEDEASDGVVSLVARVIPVNRNNDGGNRRLMPSVHLHHVKLQPVGEGFQVVDFADEIAKD